MMEAIQAELINLFMVVLFAAISFIFQKIHGLAKSKGIIAKLEANKALVKIVVDSVEQAYTHLNGNEKLNVAKLEVVKLMNEKGIKISEKEIDALIEHCVKEMNDMFKY